MIEFATPLAIPSPPRSSGIYIIHITIMTVVVASPPFLRNSEGMLSSPGAFPAFRLHTDSSTSSLSTGIGFQPLVWGLVTLE